MLIAPKNTRLAIIVFCALSSALYSQTSAAPAVEKPKDTSNPLFVFKTSSRLVVVDVVATNSKGEPVTDLKAEDFMVTEEGAPQAIRSFSFQQPSGDRNELQPVAEQLPPGVITNTPRYKKGNIWNVLVLDALNSPMLDQSDTRQQLLKVLEKLPDQPVAIYVLGSDLRLIQNFSSNRAVLRQAIGGAQDQASMLLDNPKGGHEAERYEGVWFGSLPPQAQVSIRHWEGESTASRTRNRLQLTLDALNAIASNLKSLPGRKNLIWVSEGFPFSIEPGTVVRAHEPVSGQNYTVAVSQTANALFDSQIAIYPIDSRGIVLNQVYDPASRGYDALGQGESQIGLHSTVSEQLSNLNVTHTSMVEVAERTGGRAFYNRNEIGNAIIESMNDGSTYYTLAYYPASHNWNGKFRRISVKVKRPGVKLRHRSGYFAIEPGAFTHQTPAEQTRQLNQALDLNAPVSTQLLFQARVLPPSAQSQNQVVVNYLIPAAGLSFERGADQLQHASVNCAVGVYSMKGVSIKRDGATMTAALKADVYDKIVQQGFPCQQKLSLPPGGYMLRLAVRDNVTGRIGTVDTMVSVPAEQAQKTPE
ncbi:MAG: VWA domain-containing protein [Acidobacteriia bacterium]|nr:VWA domain-containing protein [Terriglobia bacterium]